MKSIIKDGRYYILIDAGGTYVKSIILNRGKDIVSDSYSVTEINSLGSREYIMENIIRILQRYIINTHGQARGILPFGLINLGNKPCKT